MGVDIQIEDTSYLGTTPQTYTVDLTSVQVEQDIAVQQTQASFKVRVYGTWSTDHWVWPIARPRAGQEVVFLNAQGTREFGGILLNVSEDDLQPGIMEYTCRCGDYTKWFDRHLVNSTYAQNTTAQQLIADIVSTYVNTPGNSRTFTTNNVQQYPSITLPILQFVYIPPSQVIGQLVQMLGWGFFIDFYRDVNFFSTESFQSPLPNNTLDADDAWNDRELNPSRYSDWVDLTIGEDVSQLKNRVFITGIYVADQQLYSESKVADGQTTVFNMGYEPANNVSQVTVAVNGTYQQIALDLVDGTPGGPAEANTAYVNFSQQTIRFGTAPANGDTITITYYPMTQTVVSQQDVASQNYMASIDGTDGIYEYNRLDPSLSAELPQLAQTRAQMTLNKYAMPHIQGTFTSYLSGWRVGQAFTFLSQRRFQGDLNGEQFFVTRVTKKIVQIEQGGDWLWQYSIQFANTPFEF